jgi:DNA-binding transcriptional MocR family regulator
MTIYIPETKDRTGPKYKVIADAIADDIHEGRLAPGTKLPTHRDLAYHLGVTVGTITRAYSELQRRGVAGGRVGSGTFVLDRTRRNPIFPSPLEISAREPLKRNDHRLTLDHPNTTDIDLSMNRPTPGPEIELLAQTLSELCASPNLSTFTQYNPAPGMPLHRAAMARLLGTVGLDCEGEDIILTSGAQHAMAASAMALLNAGDVLLTEHLTYPGMTSIAAHLGVKIRPVMMDGYGMRPDALEAAVRETGARVVYVVPIMQNPTTATMNQERLNAIADIAIRHNLILMEDDVYGFQPKHRNPPLAQLAPDNTVYTNGFAKSIAPGLRVGCMKAPKALFTALAQAVQITGWMIPPLMGEIAAHWINSGMAQHIIAWHQDEMIARNALAADILKGFSFKSQPECLHMWLELPEGHHAADTMQSLRDQGVILAGPDSFVTSQADVPRSLRLCLGSSPTRQLLQVGLERVRQVLTDKPVAGLSRLDNMVI